MLQKALNEGTKVAVSVRFDIFNILTSGHPDIHLSNVHNVHAPKVVEKPKIEGLTLFSPHSRYHNILLLQQIILLYY